jgi:hypothetical protein
MRDDTHQVHARIVEIGEALGFRAKREVTLKVQQGYGPRLDVLWSLPLTRAQLAATCALEARLPLVARF